jgi:UDP-N-acetylglucosamine--N-acetylmuramyl-(pentapeptide) pyrophosphoryl-undecaprenol N-acetylglucosamine transferase
MMVRLIGHREVSRVLADWQVLHLVGKDAIEPIRIAYARQGIAAVVQSFCDQMGMAWSAAELAISRAGAGSVAEAWANATPTLFLPYPHHKDQHQRHNAMVLVDIGGAQVYEDQIDPVVNARQLVKPLIGLVADHTSRQRMRLKMRAQTLQDGASTVATWLATIITADLDSRGGRTPIQPSSVAWQDS